MARDGSTRKYLITINNPQNHGYDHETIKAILESFTGIEYWCLCDEIGEQGTPHTHIYAQFRNAVMFKTMQTRFHGCHFDPVHGTNQQNRDYIRKEGKWAEDAKKDTNLIETFEESGELPPDPVSGQKQSALILERIKAGASNFEIISEYPAALNKQNYMEQYRQSLLEEQYKNTFRNLTVTYIWGETSSGKTRGVMEKYGYSSVYRVTNYAHPFDGYKGEDVLVFEEFRSSLLIGDMLNYLDGYPIRLPCRYADKTACYTKVYLITNIPLEMQYPNIQTDSPETWNAFRRRIDKVRRIDLDLVELGEKGFAPALAEGEAPHVQ